MAKELDNQLRLVTLFQLDSDRAKFSEFIAAIEAAGFKERSDFWKNPGGDASVMLKTTVFKNDKVNKAKEKFNMQGFGFETESAGTYIKESTYIIGEKVKVLMGTGKKALGEIKKVAFGDGYYFVEVAGKIVSRSLHELEPFNEGKDKLVKHSKKKLSLDEAISCAMEDKHFTDEDGELTDEVPNSLPRFKNEPEWEYESESKSLPSLHWRKVTALLNDSKPGTVGYEAQGRKHKYSILFLGDDKEDGKFALHIDELGNAEMTSDFLRALEVRAEKIEAGRSLNNIEEEIDESFDVEDRKKLINREKEYMSIDELVEEAVNMTEISEEFAFTEDGAIDYGDTEARQDDSCFEGYSNCCDAPIYGETDICPKCGEHCEITSGSEEGIEDAVENIWPDKEVKKEDRNAQLVGAPIKEDNLSPSEGQIDYIVKNINSIPENNDAYRFVEDEDKAGLIEYLTVHYDNDALIALCTDIEEEIEGSSLEGKVSAAIDNAKGGGEFTESNFEEGMDPEPIKESKSTKRYNILKEDIETVTNIAKGKGYKVIKVQGELVESKKAGVMNILVEKNGRRAVITYNDNLNTKPWSWNGAKFNFMQEALETIYVTSKQILKEGKTIEKKELREGSKRVEQILEQRKFATKTDKLSLTEKQRREQRSQEILKKMLNGDLIKRKFDR